MIATILEPGNQVIDWSSRTLDLCSRQGFSFSPAWKTKAPMPCFSSNTCRSLAFLAAWQQEIHATFAFPAAMLQRGEKKPWHSKNVNAPICLNSALEKNKQTQNETYKRSSGQNETGVKIWCYETQQFWGVNGTTGGCGQGCAVMLHGCSGLREPWSSEGCVYQSPFSPSYPLQPKDGSPPQERRCYLYPLSILVPTRIS